jgi:hypothetical protein
MSILRYFNKHQGWHDGKRTPFGGGGGGWNPISAITDPISSAIGTDGGGGGILGGLADIDPGPAIGSGLAEVDQFVNNEIPGGWYTVGAAAAGGTALYFAPEIMAAMGTQAGTAITTEVGKEAFFTALANGAPSTQAISAGLAAEAGVAGTAGALTTEQILSSTGFTPTPGSGASFAIDPSAAYTTGAGGISNAVTATPGADAILNAPPTTLSNLTPPGTGTFGSISPPLTGSGAIPGAGAVTNSAGLTGALPAGVMVGDGTLGTTIGQTYMAAAPGQFAVDAFGSAIPSGTAGIAGTVPSGLSLSELATNAKRLQSIAKLLGGSGANITGRSAPTAGQWTQQAAQNFAQATPEQFGGYYQMNQNPFTFSNPLAAALKGKDATGLDVSGTGGTTLQSQNLAKLLA